MYFAETLTALQEAVKLTFDVEYPVTRFRSIYVGVDYPGEEADAPGIWVDFEPAGDLVIAGIGHYELTDAAEAGQRQFTRWTFQGEAVFTVFSLSSLERAMLLDEMIKVIAFGREDPARSQFRTSLENTDLVSLAMQWDRFTVSPSSQGAPTPWGTDQVVYEQSVRVGLIGEVISDDASQVLLGTLGAIEFIDHREGEADPTLSPPYSEDAGIWR